MQFKYPKYAHGVGPEMMAMPVEQLLRVARHPIRVLPSQQAIYPWLARWMADQLKERNARGEPTRWILPVGPRGQYPLLASICNEERISLKNMFAFFMDNFLDWQGRPIAADHPLNFQGFMQKYFYDLLAPDLRPPESQVVFPSIYDIDAYSEALRRLGGADATLGGFGYRGLLAFIENPSTRWHKVTADELAASKTRIVQLLDDTIVALSQRMLGGNSQLLPRMAVTVGMADILASRHIHLVLEGGSWKQFILRVFALTTERDPEYPITLLHGHPSVEITTDPTCVEPVRMGMTP